MYVNPFQISLETLIGAAPLLGHGLEDRGSIRDHQDPALVQRLQKHSSTHLRDETQQDLFCVAPLDILVTERDGRKQYHLIEINGTGIGGLTNLTGQAVSAVLAGFQQWAEQMPHEDTVVLVASSGKEAADAPRLNKLVHEKILYAEALKRGFDYTGRPARVVAMPALMQAPAAMPARGPAIVLGYMKEFLAHVQMDAAGTLSLFGRRVHAAVNDRFCLNLLHQFDHRVDLRGLQTMNRGFLAGADKGVAYALLNDFLDTSPAGCVTRVPCTRAHDRDELIAAVLRWVRGGRRAVIKPQGTGLGHGIEFFLDADEDEAAVVARIDCSVAQTEALYALKGGAFPYTVCEFLDTCTIPAAGHPLRGHKYELRVVVYRDGMTLKAFPSIAKVACEPYDPARPVPLSLINNVTASAQAKQAAGVEFMLPLANPETLALLGIPPADLLALCETATRFVRHLLDRVQDEPTFFGLPTSPVAVPALGSGSPTPSGWEGEAPAEPRP